MASHSSLTSGMSSCTTGGASSTPWPSAEGFLEASIPGFSILSSLLKSYFHIELSSLIVYILPFAAVIAAINYFYDPVSDYITKYGVCNAEIRSSDEMYNYLMYWLSQQNFSSNTLSFIASTRTGSDSLWDPYDDDPDSDSLDTDNEVDWQLAEEDFDQYWAQLTKRDRIKNLYFTPCDGRHWFKHKGVYILLTRSSIERQYGWRSARSETLFLTCLGRDTNVLKDLLREAQKLYIERDGSSTVIYRRASDMDDWQRCMARPPRPLSTVVLDNQQKDAIVEDLKEYLHPLTKRWYANRGIPYRRGYLLHGPPGTGKTSLCVALAGMFGLKVYVASLNSRTLTEEGLAALFGWLPQRCIVLLEDVDSAGITHKRVEDKPKPDKSDKTEKTDEESGPDNKSSTNNDSKSGISLSALLNIIDGVASSEGRILIMTTNHVEKLDPALLRPGRVDMSIAFENASAATACELFQSTYLSRDEDLPTTSNDSGKKYFHKRKFNFSNEEIADLAKEFANALPSGEFSPADIQGYLLKHKASPDRAARGVEAWIVKAREEKARLKTLDAKEETKDEAVAKDTPKDVPKDEVEAKADSTLKVSPPPENGTITPPGTPTISTTA